MLSFIIPKFYDMFWNINGNILKNGYAAIYSIYTCLFNRIVHPKMKITPWFTHCQASLYMSSIWFSSFRWIQSEWYLMALPSFIMAENGCWGFISEIEVQSASIQLKKYSTWIQGVDKGLLKRIDAFVWEKYEYLCIAGGNESAYQD